MTALMRRRMMMAVKEQGGDSPLYQMYEAEDRAVSGYITYSCSGNHFRFKTTANSRGPHVTTDAVNISHSTEASTVFSLRTGDQVRIILKNIEYAVGSSNTRLNVILKENDSAGTTQFQLTEQSFPANTSGTTAELSNTATITADCDINDIFLYLYRAAEFEFDLELYVNGTRYL